MQYPAYNDYKETGINWLGKVPSHWEVRKLKLIAKVVTGNTPPKSDSDNYDMEGYLWIKPDNLDALKPITTTKEYLTEAGSKKANLIPPLSVLVCCIGSVGKFGYSDEYVTTNQQINSVVFDVEINSRFGIYLIASSESEHIRFSNITVVAILNSNNQSQIKFAFPDINEQQKISDFLDYKTQQIDQLIEKKKTLIEKLNEQRIAAITQAVTKGLNKNAKMKPSGVDWLGDVPGHWDVMQFKDRCRVVSGQVDPTEPEYEDLPLIAPDHIEKGSGRLLGIESANEQGAISGKYYFTKGDLLYSKIRPELNKLCIAPSDGLCSADMYAIRTEKGYLVEFLFYLMLSKYFHQYAILESMRVAMPKINRDALGQFKILVPPVSEQVKIIEEIRVVLEKIRNNIDISTRSIWILEEYRTALITNAVTGKIDVRNYDLGEGGK